MKKLLVLLVLLFAADAVPQSFLSLDGIETPEGRTILLYHYGLQNYRAYAPVYKFDVVTGYEKKIMDAYFVNGSHTRSVQDFEFFPEDTANFIDCGFGMEPDDIAFVAYNDSSVAGFQSPFYYVDISKQDPSRTYATDWQLNRSFDGGLSYPEDSVLNFYMISVSEFNDDEIFGIDQQNRLIKSFDGGRTSIIVDNSTIYEDIYFHPEFFYDPDHIHIYRTNASYDSYNLYVSADNGNSYTWVMKKQYPQSFVFSNDPSTSGTCYLGYYYHLYKSTNYGEGFNPLYSFDERIMGIYPKPGTQSMYVSTQYHLYKLENDTLTTLKEIPPDPDLVNYYPLQVGNVWVYDGTTWNFPNSETYQFTRKVNDMILKPNQKIYFEVEESIVGSGYSRKFYERVDTQNVRVYRYDEDSVQSGQEYLIDNLRASVGDSIKSYRFETNVPAAMIDFYDTTIFGLDKGSKTYESVSLTSYQYQLVQGFGLTYIQNGYDFGWDSRNLKGAVINGIVYGDTTLTGIEDEIQPVNTFSLSQNYPNPFNPVTKIGYSLGKYGPVTIKVYDVLGKEIITLLNSEKPAGIYSVKFDGSNLASGIYYYQMRSGDFIQTKKLLLLK